MRRPLSVGLTADVMRQLWREMVERGVLADLLLIGAGKMGMTILRDESIRELRAVGSMERVRGAGSGGERCGQADLDES